MISFLGGIITFTCNILVQGKIITIGVRQSINECYADDNHDGNEKDRYEFEGLLAFCLFLVSFVYMEEKTEKQTGYETSDMVGEVDVIVYEDWNQIYAQYETIK